MFPGIRVFIGRKIDPRPQRLRGDLLFGCRNRESEEKVKGRIRRALGPATGLMVLLLSGGLMLGAEPSQQPQLPAPIDPQRVQDQDDMKWSDYKPIPGVNWADPALKPTRRQFRVALVAIDFDDQPFVITQPKQKELFGNPQIDPVPRDKVAQFYADFFNTPSSVNYGQTINGYWMEQSRGKIGIAKLDAFGPYRMPKKLFQYGLNEYGQETAAPAGFVADGRMEPDADSLWARDAGADIKSKYDGVLRIYAGYDETGVWQEFGEMKFTSRDAIPPEWGNPDATKPRWVVTRYVPWTSWKAGAQQWGLSSMRQGENSGTITHEIAHLMFRVGDNNNNPYSQPYHRVGTGPWDIMDRGSFNGPGGPHRRWVVPPTEGAAMPAGLMLRSKLLHDFLPEKAVLHLNRNGLAQSGLAVGRVVARAFEAGSGQLSGITVTLDGDEPRDRTPLEDINQNPLAHRPEFNYYTVEVVQRVGYDSFTPDNGVLITKNKYGGATDGTGRGGQVSETAANSLNTRIATGAPSAGTEGRGAGGRGGRAGGGGTCGYNCFAWVIDAHPEDMKMVDFKKANGETVMRTVADYRQLNDALFHAGLNSGSQYEWQDPHNRLHFYIVAVGIQSNNGARSYTIGVRSLDGSGPQKRGVAIANATAQRATDTIRTCMFTLTNTGMPAVTDAALHPHDVNAYLGSDIYRLSVTVEGAGWSAHLRNGALAAIPFGATLGVPVIMTRAGNAAATGTVTLKGVSESDPGKRAVSTCAVRR
jgi:M6 family metalloprotease-like protein